MAVRSPSVPFAQRCTGAWRAQTGCEARGGLGALHLPDLFRVMCFGAKSPWSERISGTTKFLISVAFFCFFFARFYDI